MSWPGLGIVTSLLAIICSSISYVELKNYQVYLGFVMGISSLALIYNIRCSGARNRDLYTTLNLALTPTLSCTYGTARRWRTAKGLI